MALTPTVDLVGMAYAAAGGWPVASQQPVPVASLPNTNSGSEPTTVKSCPKCKGQSGYCCSPGEPGHLKECTAPRRKRSEPEPSAQKKAGESEDHHHRSHQRQQPSKQPKAASGSAAVPPPSHASAPLWLRRTHRRPEQKQAAALADRSARPPPAPSAAYKYTLPRGHTASQRKRIVSNPQGLLGRFGLVENPTNSWPCYGKRFTDQEQEWRGRGIDDRL